ncbi:MAG TPA: acyl-CoA dehydrogenase [Leeuwenhoekiella sp.]|nr:acyl-CoA dehydrogenase [Leeuwenhoekiella sp.]
MLPEAVLNCISTHNLWNIWVPKAYGGLEMSLTEGLNVLKLLAKTDGSLGWTVTLCSGANYFIGNMEPEGAGAIFNLPGKNICFGGSGAVGGTAEKSGNFYFISGQWPYATGADYITHFTLNATITENGNPVKNEDGSPTICSFVVPKSEVEVIHDWKSMGLKASVTKSFKIKATRVDKKFSFHYNSYHLPQAIYKIPFRIFADLTLWVNYIGMADHFQEAAAPFLQQERLAKLSAQITKADDQINTISKAINSDSLHENEFSNYGEEIHQAGIDSIRQLSAGIIEIYPLLGIKASAIDQELNQVFRDYFTATQHHNFKGE